MNSFDKIAIFGILLAFGISGFLFSLVFVEDKDQVVTTETTSVITTNQVTRFENTSSLIESTTPASTMDTTLVVATSRRECLGNSSGNALCDEANNIKACEYDGGDCCLHSVFCNWCQPEECLCHLDGQAYCRRHGIEIYYPPDEKKACQDAGGDTRLVGDKICDDENNIPECLHDVFDCCEEEASFYFCAECKCLF